MGLLDDIITSKTDALLLMHGLGSLVILAVYPIHACVRIMNHLHHPAHVLRIKQKKSTNTGTPGRIG